MVKIAKKLFTVSVVVLTIVWSIGLAAFLPAMATAATCPTLQSGDLFKIPGNSAVYLVNADGKRMYFFNAEVYKSWYDDYSGVQEIAATCTDSYPSGGAVAYRPGSKLVKTVISPSVYAVQPNGQLLKIADEASAKALYGTNWAKLVRDLADVYFDTYVVGTGTLTDTPHNGMLVMKEGTTDVYNVVSGKLYKVDGTLTAAAKGDVRTVSAATFGKLEVAGTTVTAASVVENPAQAGKTTGGTTGGTTVTGNVTVTLAADTPSAGNVAKNATRYAFLKFNVSGEGTISSLVIKRVGAGNSTEIENVYLYEGDTRLTTGRSVNSSSHLVNFTGLNLKVAGTRTLTVVADMLSSGWSTYGSHAFQIASAASFSGVNVGGSFPITGNTMTVSNVSSGSITVSKSGSLSNPKLGQTGAKLAEFQLQAGSGEDIQVKSVTLYQVGNITRSNLSNFVLKQGTETIATAEGLNSTDHLVFTFTKPFDMAKGASRVFSVYGDISGTAKKSDTIRFYVENAADVYAVGKTYGYGVGVTYTQSAGYDNASNDGTDASWTSLDAGQVTMTFKGPAVSDFSVDTQDVEIFRFTFNSINNVEIKNTRVTLTAGGTDSDADANDDGGLFNDTTANYTDVKLVDADTGEVLAGPFDVVYATTADDTTYSKTLTDIWNVAAGKTRTIKVTADVANFTAASNETIKFTLAAFQASDIKNLDNNQYIATTDIVPSSATVGNTHNVKAASLALSLAGTPVATTYINGSANLPMTAVNFKAGTGKDVYVDTVKFTVVGANSCATESDCVLTADLYDGSTKVGTTKSLVASDSTVTFDNLDVKVGKGLTKTLLVKANLITLSTVSSSPATTLKFNITTDSTDVTATDLEGNTVEAAISGDTVTGPTHTVASSGSLTVALAPDVAAVSAYDPAATESRIIIAGTQNVALANYKFNATNESLKLSKVRITVPSSATDEVLGLALFDGATQLTEYTAPNTSVNGVDFTSWLADFVVPKNGNKVLTVKANLNTVADGADSGASVTTTISNASGSFEARSAEGSNTVLTESDVASLGVVGRTLTLRKAGLVVTEESLPTTAIVNSAENDIYKFSMAANGGDVAVKQLKLQITLNDNGAAGALTATGFKLYRGSSNISSLVAIQDVTAATQIEMKAGAGITTTNTARTILVQFSSEEALTAGSSNVYTLKATLGGYSVTADDDGITTKLVTTNDESTGVSSYNQLADIDTTASELAVSLGSSTTTADGTEDTTPTDGTDIVWSDNASNSHDSTAADAAAPASSDDWVNGYQVKNGPFSGKSMNN